VVTGVGVDVSKFFEVGEEARVS